jgi:hypothetical protein
MSEAWNDWPFDWAFTRFLDFLAAGRGPVTLANFPWENALGLALVVIGLVIMLKSDKRAERNTALADRMDALYGRLDNCVAIGPGVDFYPDIMGEATAVFQSIEDIGIPTPHCIGLDRPSTYLAAHRFVGAVAPMIRGTHIDLAKREAPKIIKGLGLTESWPKKWWQFWR